MALPSQTLRILGVTYAGWVYDNAGTAAMTQIKKANKVDFPLDTTDVNFEGDEQLDKVPQFNGLNVDLTFDYYDIKALGAASAFNKTVITSSPPLGATEAVPFGENAETAGITRGFVAKFNALDTVANATGVYGIYVPIVDWYVITPPSLAYKSKAQLQLKGTARKTTVDVAGDALPTGPTDGVFWYMLKF